MIKNQGCSIKIRPYFNNVSVHPGRKSNMDRDRGDEYYLPVSFCLFLPHDVIQLTFVELSINISIRLYRNGGDNNEPSFEAGQLSDPGRPAE